MKLAVIGTGYVGLVSGTCFSELGHNVVCVDVDAGKIERLQRGEIPIFEPGLSELVRHNTEQGRLDFSTDTQKAVENSVAIFIAVGTPSQGTEGHADLSQVMAAANSVGRFMNGYKVVVDKSTVPVGTSRKIRAVIQSQLDQRGLPHEFDVVSNPEFLKEGAAIDDFMNPDRVVIGCDNERTFALMDELYVHFARNARPILHMSPESAEMTKYAANAMLATKISLMNEIANICERVGADVKDVRDGIGSDSRIGYRFIYPGLGYGGSCFPKDVKALIQTARANAWEPRILEAVDAANERQKESLLSKMRAYYGDSLAQKRFALWGLAFKPETDDVREAPSLVMIKALRAAGARVNTFDPKANEQARKALGADEAVAYFTNSYDALEGCDALIVATEWSFLKNPDFERMKTLMAAPVIFDGRNTYSRARMKALGFDYFSIGREPVRGHSPEKT